jgi:hypothetical protein
MGDGFAGRPSPAAATWLEAGMRKRIIALVVLLMTTVTVTAVGPGALSPAFADNGVISSRD